MGAGGQVVSVCSGEQIFKSAIIWCNLILRSGPSYRWGDIRPVSVSMTETHSPRKTVKERQMTDTSNNDLPTHASDVLRLCKYELNVLKHCADPQPDDGIKPGAALWSAVESLSTGGYISEGKLTEKGWKALREDET